MDSPPPVREPREIVEWARVLRLHTVAGPTLHRAQPDIEQGGVVLERVSQAGALVQPSRRSRFEFEIVRHRVFFRRRNQVRDLCALVGRQPGTVAMALEQPSAPLLAAGGQLLGRELRSVGHTERPVSKCHDVFTLRP
jgi:hypothetical protein